jgi:hypothetical protein
MAAPTLGEGRAELHGRLADLVRQPARRPARQAFLASDTVGVSRSTGPKPVKARHQVPARYSAPPALLGKDGSVPPSAEDPKPPGSDLMLPRYGVAGWTNDGSGYSSATGMVTQGSSDASVVTSLGVHHQARDSEVTVTSHRIGHAPVEELRRQAVMHARSIAARRHGAEAVGPAQFDRAMTGWDPVSISVDGQPTAFTITDLGDGWAAVGQAPMSSITIAAYRFPPTDVALVRLPDLPTHMFRPRVPRPPRARRFPDEQLQAGKGPGDRDNVQLTYADRRLTGTFDGVSVDVALDVPRSHSTAIGHFAGSAISATWELGDNSTQHPDVKSTLHGRYADKNFTLNGRFHLDDDYTIESAEIIGNFAGEAVHASVQALDGGLSDTSTVAIDGEFAGSAFALAATVSPNLSGGIVCGTVNAGPVRLDAKVRRAPRVINLSGAFHGPPALLAFIAGVYLFFD